MVVFTHLERMHTFVNIFWPDVAHRTTLFKMTSRGTTAKFSYLFVFSSRQVIGVRHSLGKAHVSSHGTTWSLHSTWGPRPDPQTNSKRACSKERVAFSNQEIGRLKISMRINTVSICNEKP